VILEAQDLACRRGERVVFAGIGFALAPGGALVVAGPNGAGKSSLLRLIAGLAEREAGHLLCDGAEVSRDWAAFRARFHYLGHLDAVKPSLSVAENLAFWARLYGVAPASDAALAPFGLADLADLPARFLSAGQRRRLALSRLCAVRRPLWLLDEPLTALDDAAADSFARAAADHRAAGGLIVVAAHGAMPLPDAAHLRLEPPAAPGPEDEAAAGADWTARAAQPTSAP
jgi:heme exporter protein A